MLNDNDIKLICKFMIMQDFKKDVDKDLFDLQTKLKLVQEQMILSEDYAQKSRIIQNELKGLEKNE